MARRGSRTGARALVGSCCLLFALLASAVPFASAGMASRVVAVGLLLGAAAEAVRAGAPAARRVLVAVHLVCGAVCLLPQVPLPVVGAAAGVVLLSSGAVEFWTGLAPVWSWSALALAGSALVTGSVATLWPDPVVLPMVIGLGWRLAPVGAGLLVDAWRGAAREARRAPGREWGRVAALALAVLVTAGTIGTDDRGALPGFYDVDVPSGAAPGALLRAERSGAPAGATAVRLLYATTAASGDAVAAVGLLLLPGATPSADLPLVVWAHGTTGVARRCAPSVLGEQAGGLASAQDLLGAGYAVLALDLPGLGISGPSAYLLGVEEGRAVLDGIRAARSLPGVRGGATVLWGYDQGGHAVLWADQLAPAYAPDVPISGVVAVAPFTDPAAAFAGAIAAGHAGSLGVDLVTAYAARYPDVRLADYTTADRALVDELAARCAGDRGLVGGAWAQASGFDQAWTLPVGSPLARRLAENTPSGPFTANVLVVHGAADTELTAALQDDWVQSRCAAGARLEYRKVVGAGHADVDREGSQAVVGVLGWIADRFAGRAAKATCQ